MAIKTPEVNNESKEKIQKPITREIDVDLNDEPERMQVDFEDEDVANSFASQPTKPSKDVAPKINPDKSIDEIKNEITEYENNKSGIATHKDLLKQAKFIIGMYDTGAATVCDMISGNKSRTSTYKMLTEEKDLLSGQLALILAKYQHKFKIEYSFLVGLLLIAGANVTQAVQDKKKNKALKPEKQIVEKHEKKPNEPGYKHNGEEIKPDVPSSKPVQPILNEIEVPSAPPEKQKRTYNKKKQE